MSKITGKIIYIYPTEQMVSKSGNAFEKRDFVLAMQSFDRETSEPTIDDNNTPQLTLTGKRCRQLDHIAQGQIVTVDFYLRGRRYRDKDNKERIVTDINVTSVRAVGGTDAAHSMAAPAPAPGTPQPTTPAQKAAGDLPF